MSLSSADLSHVETVLAQGKKPRVMFTDEAGQVAGKSGKVVELGPEREGDFVVVAFGSDQLPFSPAELRLPERGETSRAKAPRQRRSESEPAPGPPPGPGLLPDEPAESAPAERKTSRVSQSPETEPSTPAAPARKKTTRARTAKDKHPELTLTVTFEDGEWAVAVAKGARNFVKGVHISHAAALAMCSAAGSTEVDEVVTEVVDKIRSQASEEAEALRKRLEEAEARLAELG